MGLEIGKYVQVKCEDGKLIITLDEIKGKMVEAETLFMERTICDLIRNLSKEKSADAQILMRNYMMERFLERISLSEYKDKFILKGGM